MLSGSDAEVMCGEWETGETPSSVSGEQFNIVLPITSIVRHPGYTISRGEMCQLSIVAHATQLQLECVLMMAKLLISLCKRPTHEA